MVVHLLRRVFEFATDTVSKSSHKQDHDRIHAILNRAVYVLPGESITDALLLAADKGIPTVCLQPGTTYTVGHTLTIPEGVTLDGGAMGISGYGGAILQPSLTPPDVMVQLSDYSGLRGIKFRMQTAPVGILVQSKVNMIDRCSFTSTNPAVIGVKYGGALYQAMQYTSFNVPGRCVDAIAAYKEPDTPHYYGVNEFTSLHNVYGGQRGALRVEGKMSSYDDKFEIRTEAGYVVEVGGGQYQSDLSMYSPYMELYAAGAPVKAFKVNNACRLSIHRGQMFCHLATNADSVAFTFDQAGVLNMLGTEVLRFETGFAGTIAYAPQNVSGVRMTNVDTASTLTYPASDANVFNYVSA